MFSLPTGTVTFLLGDVEGSTRAWARGNESMVSELAALDRAVDEAVGVHGGVRPVEQGEGDSFVAAFDRPSAALAAAAAIQRELQRPGAQAAGLRVRLGVHTGEVTVRNGSRYAGLALARCARIRDCGHGGQTLASATTAALVADRLPDRLVLTDLGEHRLADLARPERIFQLLDPSLPSEFPPLRVLDDTPNNLPVQLTSFVGRDEDVRTVGDLISDNRLVTLTGPGGAGKTRLALQAAAAYIDRYDQAWFVDLSGVAVDATAECDSEVMAAIAAAIGARPEGDESPGAAVTDALKRRRTLIVLDNCEHLAAPSARVAELILRAAPGVTVLATSRQPLGASGEQTWVVPNLSLPQPEIELGPVALEDSEAVALFVERARQVRPTFAVSDANRAAVARICRRLDGIPLAMELAAARIRLLTPEHIAEAIDDRFRLLTGSPRTAVPRQATLRSSIDWGHELLDEDERVVFRRLAVFAGPFTLEDAEAVVAADIGTTQRRMDAWHVLDHLATLVDRSMVVADDVEGVARYRLLDSLRAYGLERLDEAGEREALDDAHLVRMVEVAAVMAPLHGRRPSWLQPGWRAADLEAALRWAKERERPEYGELAARMSDLWRRRWPQRALGLADSAVAAMESTAEPPYGAAWTLAMVLLIGHDAGQASAGRLERLRDNIELLRQHPDTDPHELTTANAFATLFAARYGQPTTVDELLDVSVYATRTGNKRLTGAARFHLLLMARHNGDLTLLGRVASEVVAEPADSDDRQGLLGSAANYALTLGRVDEAEQLVHASRDDSNAAMRSSAYQVLATVAYHREDRPALAHVHEALAQISEDAPFVRATFEYAATLLAVHDGVATPTIEPSAVPAGLHHRGLQTLVDSVGDTPAAALPLFAAADVAPHSLDGITRSSLLPLVHRRLGQPGAAAVVLSEAVAGRRDQTDIAWPDVLAEIAALLVDHGDPSDAARVLGVRERHLTETGCRIGWIPSRFHDEARHRLEEHLGVDRLVASSAEGRSLPPPAAMAVIVSLVDELVVATSRQGRPPFGWDSLTAAERRVVDLVARGKTNREAAEALGIKASTVHSHLLHVYAKLGIGSRAELAAEHTRDLLSRSGDG
ncbi:MAG TPA: LuxR C-terminal-related transcriptional regulator [Acidimicrobiales bacterium]|nr:LuxR C-terminal-related transcriptional regulator [Acidimicrobiales bacterium]